MNINLTLIGQSITFFFFVWFTMKFVWPPLTQALAERRKKIADDLAAAEKGRHEQELAEKRAIKVIKEAKDKAQEIINHAEKRGNEVTEEAKDKAKEEAARIVAAAKGEIEQETNRAREQLRAAVAELAVAGAARILEKEIDAKVHAQMVDKLVEQL
ncbi:MAG: F0F1 ATP synthase subunit B [Gammaproteobacteria bacterium]|nr:F0F1 ATP synthase subunit B [Gammaproteobacteria bacterium]